MEVKSKKSVLFIVNPFSGRSSKSEFAAKIKEALDTKIFIYDIVYTEYSGHAIEIAKAAVAESYDIVVAVGGDGSVNEVAQALVNTDTVLGILPGGSGNGFAMHLGLGRNTFAAVNFLNHGKVLTIDTCTVNDRFFSNVAGIGFDARIAFLTKKNKKRGFLPYLMTSIRESSKFKSTGLTIIIDGQKVKGKYAAAVVANASMYGYNFTISPAATLQDGKMDVMLIKEAPLYKYFFESYRFLNRSLHKSSITEEYQGREIKIILDDIDYIHVDGEGYVAELILDFVIRPRSLKVLVPEKRTGTWDL